MTATARLLLLAVALLGLAHIAFLPPFVRPENGMPLLQLFILATIFNAGGTLINFAVSAFAGSLADSLTRDRRKARWFARLSAALFALLAVRMIFERR